MSKWFIGNLQNNEFILCHNGKLIRAELAYLPQRIAKDKTLVLKCKDPLSPEQYGALKEAWGKIKDKSILLEGNWEIRIE